jgi:hypothetical protein
MYDNDFLTISLDQWGFTINSEPFYVSITWGVIALGVSVFALMRVLKIRKRSK